MKKVSLTFVSVALFGFSFSFAVSSNKSTKKTEAYSTSNLPTTIDLNDTSASNIRSYYSSLNSLSQSERQGTNLLKNLKTILKNGQKYYSYDSGNAIWQMYEITDRDWDKSPASSTTYGTYNSSTNKITGYSYGSNGSYKNNPYIHALYINRNVENLTMAWGNHNQDEWGINREHVWPKAEGFDTVASGETGGARGDPMHLIAGNGYSNNIHSNYFYGYVNTSSSYTDCGTKYSNQSGNLLGKSLTVGGTKSVFEPQDSDKGDIARAIFYMVARYNYLSGSDSDGIDSNNPNLALAQSLSDWSSSAYSSTTTTTGKMGIMTDLLAWHRADPVDEYEIHRNNLLYTNFTNNRNPFIDFPEWADFIWGTAVYNGRQYKSYSSTPTGYAKPSSDKINGYNGGTPVTISASVKDSKTFYVGDTITKSDIEVVDSNDNIIDDFTFSDYQFKYSDASSGGALTNKVFTDAISAEGSACSLAVQVQRKARFNPDLESGTSSLVFTKACGGSGSADDSKSWTITSDANESAYDSTKGVHYGTGSAAVEYIQLVSNSFSGLKITQIVVNASGASGVSGSVSVTIGGNAFGEVQSFNSTASDKTFTGSAIAGEIVVRIYKASAAVKAIYCKSVVITYGATDTAINLANYIMYEDTENQCVSKFAIAKGYFENLSSNERSSFVTSNDYVIKTARERFEAWANNRGEVIEYNAGEYIISKSLMNSNYRTDGKIDAVALIITIVSSLTLLTIPTCLIVKRRKK